MCARAAYWHAQLDDLTRRFEALHVAELGDMLEAEVDDTTEDIEDFWGLDEEL